ncbi:MAG: sulfite exporter TauE/SafE family protein [Gammaproteobacteria bacterium]
MDSTPLIIAFGIGFLSSIHCLSMCGGIMGALVMGLGPEKRDRPTELAILVMGYNLGRLLSYGLAGALMAGLLGSLAAWLPGTSGHEILRVLAGVLMVGVGLYLGGWYPKLIVIEKLGVPLWRRLQPLSRRLLPVETPSRAFLYGMVWGWLPCGMVYTMLLTASGQANALGGALFMLAFGLGTLPAVFSAGLLTGRMVTLGRLPYIKEIGGGIIIALALLTLLMPGAGMDSFLGFPLGSLCTVPAEH